MKLNSRLQFDLILLNKCLLSIFMLSLYLLWCFGIHVPYLVFEAAFHLRRSTSQDTLCATCVCGSGNSGHCRCKQDSRYTSRLLNFVLVLCTKDLQMDSFVPVCILTCHISLRYPVDQCDVYLLLLAGLLVYYSAFLRLFVFWWWKFQHFCGYLAYTDCLHFFH